MKGGARGLTPEGERELIRRVTDAAAESTEREAERIVRRFDLGLAVKVAIALAFFALAGGAGGYWLGMKEVQVTERRIAAAFADGTATAEALGRADGEQRPERRTGTLHRQPGHRHRRAAGLLGTAVAGRGEGRPISFLVQTVESPSPIG